MQSANDLKQLLFNINHKSYPAYKSARGAYQFPNYILSIDHVQGDPFAAPSRVSIHVTGKTAAFPPSLYDTYEKRIALQDYLLRQFARAIAPYSFRAKGSGKSGLLGVSRCGQEILERTACVFNAANGSLVLNMEIGFPANGRTIAAQQNTQFEIADMHTRNQAAQYLVYAAAQAKAAGKPYSKEAAMAKLFAAENASDVTRRCVQLFGGYGYTRKYPVERMMRDAKITEIYEGTSEVQKMVIGGALLK